MLFAPGWDAELIRMATHTPRKKAIITVSGGSELLSLLKVTTLT